MDFYDDPNYSIQMNERELQFELSELLEEEVSSLRDIISDNMNDFIKEQVDEHLSSKFSDDESFKELVIEELQKTIKI